MKIPKLTKFFTLELEQGVKYATVMMVLLIVIVATCSVFLVWPGFGPALAILSIVSHILVFIAIQFKKDRIFLLPALVMTAVAVIILLLLGLLAVIRSFSVYSILFLILAVLTAAINAYYWLALWSLFARYKKVDIDIALA